MRRARRLQADGGVDKNEPDRIIEMTKIDQLSVRFFKPLTVRADALTARLPVRAKILVGPAVALTAFLLYGGYSAYVAHANARMLERFSSQTLPVLALSAAAGATLVEVQSLYTQAFSDKDEFELEDAGKRADSARMLIADIAARDPSYAERVTELLGRWDRYKSVSDAAVQGALSGKSDIAALQKIAADKQQAYQEVNDGLTRLGKDSKEQFSALLAAAAARAAAAQRIGGVIAVLSVFMVVLVSLLIERAIRWPIERLRGAISEVAKGNFAASVHADGDDEIASMCKAFSSLLMALNAAIGETNEVVAAIARGDFSRRIEAALPGDLGRLKSGVNESADSVQRTMEALDAVMDALAAGDFSARMSDEVEGESRRKVDKAMSCLQDALKALRAALSAAAQGDFGRRVDGTLPGELGSLQGAFNQSMHALESAFGEISATTRALEAGDLTQRAHGSYAGSLGEVTQALNASIDSLAQVMQTVILTAEDVSGGAEEIARGNSELSERTERQAAALEQSAANIQQMLDSARAVAGNSAQSSALTQKASQTALGGVDVVRKTGQSMQEITEASKRIGDIIGLIDAVAFQTNLLALNAAVEAARAGEYGRGFAVVAAEVRSLAQRTTTSSKEIRDLIKAAQTRIVEGNTLVTESGRRLDEIADSSREIATLSADVAEAIQEQTQGLNQITDAIKDLESVNQQNAALVEEVAAASESLKDRSAQLRSSVMRFRLNGTRAEHPSVETAAMPLARSA